MDTRVVTAGAFILVAGFATGFFYASHVRGSDRAAPPSSSEQQVSVNPVEMKEQDINTAESCSYFQCLFKISGEIIGYAQLDGYYRSETVTGGGEENVFAGQTQTCDRFVVTGGSQPLINQFLDRIKSANTLNSVVNDNLVINLYLDDPNLDAVLIKRIRASTEQIPISLGVLQTHIEGKGAGPCTSIIRVINENKTLSAK